MNSLRKIVMAMALIAVSFSWKLAYSQQEIAPDHFDGSDVQPQKAAPAHHQKKVHAVVAKKSSAKHHHAHASA